MFFAEVRLVAEEIDLVGPDGAGFQRHFEPLPLPREFLGPQPVPFRQPRPFLQRGGGLHLVGDVARGSDRANRAPFSKYTWPRVSIQRSAPSLARRMRNRMQ